MISSRPAFSSVRAVAETGAATGSLGSCVTIVMVGRSASDEISSCSLVDHKNVWDRCWFCGLLTARVLDLKERRADETGPRMRLSERANIVRVRASGGHEASAASFLRQRRGGPVDNLTSLHFTYQG